MKYTCNIEFKAGYYEWNIFVDNEFYYTFGDSLTDDIPCNATVTVDDVERIVHDCLRLMEYDLINRDENEYDENTRKPWLNEEQKTELERQMIEILCSYCGIEV